MARSARPHLGESDTQLTARAFPDTVAAALHLNDNSATTSRMNLGCVGGAVTGACLFNVRPIPSTDRQF